MDALSGPLVEPGQTAGSNFQVGVSTVRHSSDRQAQPALDGREWHPNYPGCLWPTAAMPIHEPDHLGLRGGKFSHGPGEPPRDHVLTGSARASIDFRAAPDILVQLITRDLPAAPEPVDLPVPGGGEKPGPERELPLVKSIPCTPGCNEHVLRHFLGTALVSDNS